jgi:hypothetical protein
MLKLCPNNIALPLQIIFNESLHQSKYPTNWKLAHVNQLIKFPIIPYAFILGKRPRCQTLSNALEKSQNTKQFVSFFSNEFKMLS